LFYAVSNHHIEAMKLLVKHKAKVNIADATGQVPLHIASFDGFVPGVRLLIECGAKSNIRDVNGRLPLHLCTNSQDTGCLMALLKDTKKDQVNARDHEGMTPLHWAGFHKRPNHLKVLIRRGAREDLVDVDRKSALHWASQNGSPMCCQMLLMSQSAPMVNGADKNGNSCLHLAAAGGHANVVKVLARVGGIDLQAPDHNGRTPLHWAAAAGHEATVAALLDLDCDPLIQDSSTKTPVEYAKNNRSSTQKSCLRMLKKVAQDWQNGRRVTRNHLATGGGEQEVGKKAAPAPGAGNAPALKAVAKIAGAFAASKSIKGSGRNVARKVVQNSNTLSDTERRLSADPGLGTLSEEMEVADAVPIEDLEAEAAQPDPLRKSEPLPGLGSSASPAAAAPAEERPMSRAGEVPALKPRGGNQSPASNSQSGPDPAEKQRRASEAADLNVLRDMVRELKRDLAESRGREDASAHREGLLEQHVEYWKDQASASCPNCSGDGRNNYQHQHQQQHQKQHQHHQDQQQQQHQQQQHQQEYQQEYQQRQQQESPRSRSGRQSNGTAGKSLAALSESARATQAANTSVRPGPKVTARSSPSRSLLAALPSISK
jgi:ankyrin repeat protein